MKGLLDFLPGMGEGGGWKTFRKFVALFILAALLIALLLIKSSYIEIWEVESGSMYPTLHVGDRLVKLSTTDYEKGDLLVYYTLDDKITPVVKRLVGIYGDTVQVYDGRLYVNDEPLYPEVDYDRYPVPPNFKYEIGPGELFMTGDNQQVSDDSRFSGPISLKQVDGKAIYIFSPKRRRGKIEGQYPPPDPDEVLEAQFARDQAYRARR